MVTYMTKYNIRMLKDLISRINKNGVDINALCKNGLTALHYATEGGSKDLVEHLVSQKCQLNVKGQRKSCGIPVQIACDKGYWKIMLILIKFGCSVNVKDHAGRTLLHLLSLKGGYTENAVNEMKMEIARTIIQKGLDINSEDSRGNSILYQAVRKNDMKLVKLLLDHNCLYDKYSNNMSCVLLAAKMHYIDILTALIAHGANVNVVDHTKQTVLHYICRHGFYYNHNCFPKCTKVVNVLLTKGVKLSDKDVLHLTALDRASAVSNIETMQILLGHMHKINCTLIDGACDSALESCLSSPPNNLTYLAVKMLLKAMPANENVKAHHLFLALSSNHISVIKLLLLSGADPNIQNKNGNAVIHIVCERGLASLIPLLLSFKADINLPNSEGLRALHIACKRRDNNIICVLLKAGAITDLQDCRGWTAYHYCAQYQQDESLQLLVRKKGNINLQTYEQKETPLMMCMKFKVNSPLYHVYNYGTFNLLLENGSDLKPVDKDGNNVLLLATRNKLESSIIEKIVQYSADLNTQNRKGWSALHYAVLNKDMENITLLISHNCKVNLQIDQSEDKYSGMSPLHMALTLDDLSTVQLLLENGASLFVQDNAQKTPMQYVIDEAGMFEDKSIKFWPSMIKAGGVAKVIDGEKIIGYLTGSDLTDLLIQNGCKLVFTKFHSQADIQVNINRVIEKQQEPLTLVRLAGNVVRCNVRPNATHSAKHLPLPERMINFLTFENYNIEIKPKSDVTLLQNFFSGLVASSFSSDAYYIDDSDNEYDRYEDHYEYDDYADYYDDYYDI